MKLALGTVQFGLSYGVANTSGQVVEKEVERILSKARAYGADTIDTAIGYGESEVVLGKFGMEQWKIVTKLPAVPNDHINVGQWVIEQIKSSISRLGVSQLYGVLLHQPNQLFDRVGAGLYEALQDLKASGLTRKIGITVYDPSELTRIFDNFTFDLVQAPLNILDRRLVESGWASSLYSAGVEVHVRSIFLQGLLLVPSSQRLAKFSSWEDIWCEWDRWLREERMTPLQACLSYIKGFPYLDRVVVGVESVTQLNEILELELEELHNLPKFQPLRDMRLINPSTWDHL